MTELYPRPDDLPDSLPASIRMCPGSLPTNALLPVTRTITVLSNHRFSISRCTTNAGRTLEPEPSPKRKQQEHHVTALNLHGVVPRHSSGLFQSSGSKPASDSATSWRTASGVSSNKYRNRSNRSARTTTHWSWESRSTAVSNAPRAISVRSSCDKVKTMFIPQLTMSDGLTPPRSETRCDINLESW